MPLCLFFLFFFFNDTATTEIYTLSLHDALPILRPAPDLRLKMDWGILVAGPEDRKSTRLNSSHVRISYAVFCLKKKKHFNALVPASTCQNDRTRSSANLPSK